MIKSQLDLANESGHQVSNISWAIKTGLIPAPDIVGKKRRYYSATQFRRALIMLTNRPNTSGLTSAEICRATNIDCHRFASLRDAGLLPASIGFRGKREVWAEDILEAVREAIAKPLPKKSRTPEGYFTQYGAAEYLDVPRITFQSWILNGTVAKATHKFPGFAYAYYTQEEVEAIRETKREYFESRNNR
jgi:hypothetical protein